MLSYLHWIFTIDHHDQSFNAVVIVWVYCDGSPTALLNIVFYFHSRLTRLRFEQWLLSTVRTFGLAFRCFHPEYIQSFPSMFPFLFTRVFSASSIFFFSLAVACQCFSCDSLLHLAHPALRLPDLTLDRFFFCSSCFITDCFWPKIYFVVGSVSGPYISTPIYTFKLTMH